MFEACHRVSADEQESFFLGEGDQRVAHDLFDSAAVDYYRAGFDQIGMCLHVFDSCFRVKCHDHYVALRQQAVGQRLLDGIHEDGLFYDLIGNVISVNRVVGVLTYCFGEGASDEAQSYYSYFHRFSPII